MPPQAPRRRPRPAFSPTFPLHPTSTRPPICPPSSISRHLQALHRVTVNLPCPLGVSLAETTALGSTSPQVIISAVSPDGPSFGVLHVGDVLLHLPNGAPARSLDRAVRAIRAAPTTSVTLVLQRPSVAPLDLPPPQVREENGDGGEDERGDSGAAVAPGDVYAKQDTELAKLVTVYLAARRRATMDRRGIAVEASALAELLNLASGVARARATSSARGVSLISALVYRLRRANIPLDMKLYNILMWSFIRAGAPLRAVELFDEVVAPNVECYTTLAKAYSLLSRPDDALALIPAMRRARVTPNIRTYNALIAACVRGGQLEKARRLFSEMLVDHVTPNAVSWNIIINWHVQQKRGPRRLRDALDAFADMKASGVAPNVITFTTIMKAYAKSGLLNKAEEVFAEMKKRLPSDMDTNVYNTLLNAYAAKLEWRRCLELLDEMDGYYVPDSHASTLSRGRGLDARGGVPSHSRSFSKRRPWLSDTDTRERVSTAPSPSAQHRNIMTDRGIQCKPDAISYSLIVKACASAGRLQLAREIFDEMMEIGFTPPPNQAVVSLMSGYAKAGMLTESFSVLKDLKSWGVYPEERMLSSLMHGCLTANQPTLALSVYAKLKSAKFEADVVTRTLLLRAYGMGGELDKAFNVLKGMTRPGAQRRPNIVTYNVLIECSLQHGRRDLALKALDLLLHDEAAARATNRNTFHALVLPVRKGNRSRESPVSAVVENVLFEESYEGKGDVSERVSEIDLQYLMDVLRRVREGGVVPNGTLYEALLATCESCGEWHLGASLVHEREGGGFVVGRRDGKGVRLLEDSIRAKALSSVRT